MSGDPLTRLIARQAKHEPGDYQCLVQLSGRPESLRQLRYIMQNLGLRPLTVTFDPERFSSEEYRRFEGALEAFDVDNLRLNPRRSVADRLADSGDIQSACGLAAFTVKTAVAYGLPLIFWEPGLAGDPAGKTGLLSLSEMARRLKTLLEGESHFLSRLDLAPYLLRRTADMAGISLYGVRLADFIADDPEDVAEAAARCAVAGDKHYIRLREGSETDGTLWQNLPAVMPAQRQAGRRPTRYEILAEESPSGQPLFGETLRYCMRCCMPETAEDLAFDELGLCQPCRSSEQKMHIDWNERRQALARLLEMYRSQDGNTYDCLVPISGGKDSAFQVYFLRHVMGVNVLTATFSHNWYSRTGLANLKKVRDTFDVDHVQFTPRRSVVNKLARKSLGAIGDACWHCHAGVGSFPLELATGFGVPLLVWGESISENDGRATYEEPIPFDRDYFTKVSARLYAEEMVGGDISIFDVRPYRLPSYERIEAAEVKGVHLGDYIFWDDERQMEFMRDCFNWKEDHVEGTYKGYKSVECVMAGIHDYTKFIKRGFGRGTDHASQDVRIGLLTREEGFDLAKLFDAERPRALEYYLELSGMTEEEFETVLKACRQGKANLLP